MPKDKQLKGVTLEAVVQKRQLDQALNAKEFSVLAGVSYSTARAWFRSPGFPVIHGFVFWTDFLLWRRGQASPRDSELTTQPRAQTNTGSAPRDSSLGLPPRALQLLTQAG